MNSAKQLVSWIKRELSAPQPDIKFICRALVTETSRWVKSESFGQDLVTDPGSTGDLRLDALVEGITRYRLNAIGVKPPKWTLRTSLDEGWNPYDPPNTKGLGWALLDTLETPVEILDKGITFSYRNFEIL